MSSFLNCKPKTYLHFRVPHISKTEFFKCLLCSAESMISCNVIPLPSKTNLKSPRDTQDRPSSRANHHAHNLRFSRHIKEPSKYPKHNNLPNLLSVHSKNPHAIYKDIQRFAHQNKLKEALTILDYLDHRGIPVNPTTFASLIAACVRLKSLSSAKIVHTHVIINGLENNEFIQTKVVNIYAACGSIEDAKKVFDKLPVRSVYPWNALLRGNVVLGGSKYGEVLGTFSDMRGLGVELNVYSFSCLIKSFAGASALFQGLKTHGLLIKNGFLGSEVVRTSLIDMYFKCGKVRLAYRVFEEVEERDVVMWGAMIAGFAHNKLQREALEYTRLMIRERLEVNSVILTTILPVIGEARASKLGKEVHAYVIKTKEYSNQLFIQSGLVDMYSKCGDIVAGRKVFYGSKERNAISWTALISGYILNGRLEQALRSILWMQQEGFKPDLVTVATVLPVCGKLKELNYGKEIHAYAVKNVFLPNASVSTCLMMMYSKCGLLQYSSRVFDSMEKRSVISWTAMMDSYIYSGCLEEALGVFRSMQLSKHWADSVAMGRTLSVCGKLRRLKLGREIHGQILKKDIASVPFVSSELVKMYGSCGSIDKSRVSFDLIPVKGSMTWTAIIEAYGLSGQYGAAINEFKQMISKGFNPNHFTFKVVFSICEKAGFADEGCQFFTMMTRKYKIKASKDHYTSIINLLHHVGRIEEAEKFVLLKQSSA